MCIIAVKKAGQPMPNDDILSTMWKNNHDGGGFMFAHNGKVYIRKGFMHYEKFKKALQIVPQNSSAVLHFRIATHGGISPFMCHPFPISDSPKHLKATNFTAKVGVAHNGIIPIKPRIGLSDTAEYIASQLAPLSKALPHWYQNAHTVQMVENAIQSRMVVLNGDGEFVTMGKGWIEDSGILYSNDSYIPWESFNSFEENLLMPLNSEDCYLMIDGDMFEASEDMAIDKNHNLYYFDYDYMAWWNSGMQCSLYRSNDTPMRFDEAFAEYLEIVNDDYSW